MFALHAGNGPSFRDLVRHAQRAGLVVLALLLVELAFLIVGNRRPSARSARGYRSTARTSSAVASGRCRTTGCTRRSPCRSIGSKHGVHFSSGVQMSLRQQRILRLDRRAATRDRQRPSAPPTDLHVVGVNLPPVLMNDVGHAQLTSSSHLPSCAACAGSVISAASTQCASGAARRSASTDRSPAGSSLRSCTSLGSSQAAVGPEPVHRLAFALRELAQIARAGRHAVERGDARDAQLVGCRCTCRA